MIEMDVRKVMANNIYFRQCEIIDRHLYFFSTVEGILCRMHLDTKKIELLDVTAKSVFGKMDSSGRMRVSRGNVYMLTNDGKRLIEYYPDKKELNEYEVNCDYFLHSNSAGFYTYKNKLFIYPTGKKELIIFDCDSKVIQRREIAKELKADVFRACINGTDAWLFPKAGNQIIHQNLETFEEHSFYLDKAFEDIRDLMYYEGKIYILTEHHHSGRCNG